MEAPQEPAVMFRMEQDNEIRKQIMSNVCDEMKSKLADKLFKIVRAGEPDCMLSVEQKVAPAHKIILSGVSQLLKETFELDKSDKPSSIFVPDSRYEDVLSLLALTYDGKIKIHVDQLKSLQKIAKTLKVEIPAIATQAEAYLDEESCGILMFQTSSGSLACASSMTSPHSNAVLSPTSSSTTASSDGYENDRGTPKPVTKQPRKIKVKTQGKNRVNKKQDKKQAPVVNKFQKEPVWLKLKCPYCEKLYKKSFIKEHMRECLGNPHRIITVCPICQKEVKKSAMRMHQKNYHSSTVQ